MRRGVMTAGQPLKLGGTCSLYIDMPLGESPMRGDWIATDGGSRYLVNTVRPVKSRKHRQVTRHQMSVSRLPKDTPIPDDVHVIWLRWYPRGRRI